MTWSWNVGAQNCPSVRLNSVASSVVPGTPAEIVLLDRCDSVIGRLRFRACQKCRTGRILNIWIRDTWQRQGLGRELLQSR
ncbi:GNAT family N-acetyltransferase [Streptomyces albicerus]|uniref:GNAT family N-acetyltransferase n=1 Tax=Streptomyces albicerus TaxID=2569859 RepID=UPI00124B6A2F|nr:GNAT family N-acetyltransferase [Streptomyces albicerus]